MGLVNKVVPADELMTEARQWATDVKVLSPTAIRVLEHPFNADTDHQVDLTHMAMSAYDLFAPSAEGMEGARAFAEKRPPDFDKYVQHH